MSEITTVTGPVQRCPGAAHLKQRYVTLAAPLLIEVGIIYASPPHPSHRYETYAGHARCQASNAYTERVLLLHRDADLRQLLVRRLDVP